MPLNPDTIRHRFSTVAKDLTALAESTQSNIHLIFPPKWTTTPAELVAAEGLIHIIEGQISAAKNAIELTANTAKASVEGAAKSFGQNA